MSKAPSRRDRALTGVLLTVLSGLVFFLNFRPWQGGLLEEWGFALAWDGEGWAGFGARLAHTAGRPLHLFPAYVGLGVSDGGFVGMYLVLALVAVAQFLLTIWALSPICRSWWTRLAIGLLLATHPWWPAGLLLRFLPAQVAVLTVVIWLGLLIRYLQRGGRVRPLLIVLVPLLGLLTYQATALPLLFGVGIALVLVPTSRLRGIVAASTTTLAVGLALIWSTVIAPMFSPQSYESGLMASGGAQLLDAPRAIARTLLLDAWPVLALAVGVAVLVVALGLDRILTRRQTWLALAAVVLAPFAALAYATQPTHLHDPERVGLPVGLTIWLVLAMLAPALDRTKAWRTATICIAFVVSAIGGALAYSTWTQASVAQEALVAVVSEQRAVTPPDRTLVVADRTGRYGDVYLLLPPHLDLALQVEDGAGSPALVCTPAGTVRDHPVAARFPLTTTPDCAPYLGDDEVLPLGTGETPFGEVDLFSIPTERLPG
ncbi:hypothetical protein [Oerskovia gallyi]|uniref:Glycosyltransferase RgtA/B/C/D-like domain-containing protein n=1 Tax=Oerskovia gallyi TaxID=2762226 RepID=A0ABR8V530_9CELL|nr:hypothetical protein [Oerskovia gallyi]MBD7999896.1 hypothetical protein [Oerskovia gallyi]